jgi:hypothetical protein
MQIERERETDREKDKEIGTERERDRQREVKIVWDGERITHRKISSCPNKQKIAKVLIKSPNSNSPSDPNDSSEWII